MLHGRAAERASIDAVLTQARAGAGGGLVVSGEPGIGKSALLDDAAERAGGMTVLRTAGVEPEQDLEYAALHRLLAPLTDGIAELPGAQADALGVVFGRSREAIPDRFLVALATLTLVTDAARPRPLLCLVDDAHWSDRGSLDAVAFLARRLSTEPVAVVVATRSAGTGPLAGFPALPLTGLDDGSARRLLREHGRAPADEEVLLQTAAGNPLALRELPGAVPPGGPTGEPLKLTTRLQNAFLDRAHRRGPAARRLLLLAAADGTGRRDVVCRAAAVPPAGGARDTAAPDDLTTLDDLAALLVLDPPAIGFRFRHPLVRSAIYHAATPAERRDAHRALARALESEPGARDRWAWHLGQAADGPDERIAAALEDAADQAARHAGPGVSATARARAAQLTPAGPERIRRLVVAADAHWHRGDPIHATQLLDEAERTAPVPPDGTADGTGDGTGDGTAVARLRALVALRSGDPGDAVRLLRPVVRTASSHEPGTAVELLMLYSEAGYYAGDPGTWVAVTDSLEQRPLRGADPDEVVLRLARAVGRTRRGAPAGLLDGDLTAVGTLAEPGRLFWAGGLVWGLGDGARGGWLRRRAVERARASGAIGTLAWALERVAHDELAAGRYRDAEACADEGVRHATETGQSNVRCSLRSTLAVLAALRGRDRQAAELADEVLGEAVDRNLAAAIMRAHQAHALLALARRDPEQAVRHLRPAELAGAHPGFVLQTTADLAEAAHHLGRAELAGEAVRQLERWADAAASPELRALAARCHALNGSDDPEAAFHHALALHSPTTYPLERARTSLLLGEHLRRRRRRADARSALRTALTTFERLGAAAWADRARDELRAAGETVSDPAPDSGATLTPQELRIATAAAAGSTNREIAAQLFLSTRTIDYHLRKVFQKLGISSRVELAAYLPAG